jgi:hypothetical protein
VAGDGHPGLVADTLGLGWGAGPAQRHPVQLQRDLGGEAAGDDVLGARVAVVEQLHRQLDQPHQGAGGEGDRVEGHVGVGDGRVLGLPRRGALAGQPGQLQRLGGHGDGDGAGLEHPGLVAGQVDDTARQRQRDQVAAGGQGALGQRPLVLGAVPVAGDEPTQVAVEAQPLTLAGRLEQPALGGPRLDGLLAGEDRLTRDGRAGRPAGGRGAQLGQLAVVLGLDGVVGLALGDDLGLVVAQLVGGQVARPGGVGGGPFENGIGGGAGGGTPLAQLFQ